MFIDTFFKQSDKNPILLTTVSSRSSRLSSPSIKSSQIKNRNRINFKSKRNSSWNRPYSVTIMKDFNVNELNNSLDQNDFTPRLTKSALIYQLIRSRLEANLARSMSANKYRSINNKNIDFILS